MLPNGRVCYQLLAGGTFVRLNTYFVISASHKPLNCTLFLSSPKGFTKPQGPSPKQPNPPFMMKVP